MIDLFKLYEKVCGTYNTQQGGHIRPHRNFVDWVNDISLELFEEYFAVAEKNQTIDDRLNPFLKSANVVVGALPGSNYDVFAAPDDYEHFSSARVYLNTNNVGCPCEGVKTLDATGKCIANCGTPYQDADDKILEERKVQEGLCEVPIVKVSNSRWGSICNHKTMYPTVDKPKITQFDKGFKLAPKNLGVISFDYYRKPKAGTFAYTITNPGNIDEYIQYNQAGSTPLEWSEVLITEFINRIGKKYGQFIREQFVFDTSEANRKVTI